MTTESATLPPTSPPPPRETATTGAPRWMKIVLGLSLAANLAVAGTVVGAILKDGPPRKDMIARDLGFGPFSEALTKEDRMALRAAYAGRVPDFRDRHRQMRDEIQAVLVALRTEPFDPAALKAVMDAQHARATERFELGRTLLFDRIAGMTPEARATFADRLEERLKHGPKGRDDDKPPPPGD